MGPRPTQLGWQYCVYNGALLLAAPAIAGAMAWRLRVLGKSKEGLDERLGRYPARVSRLKDTGEPLMWIHAASVGEVGVAASLIGEVRRLEPRARVVLSTTTPTGRQLAEKPGLVVDALIYFPFDLPWVAARALDAIGPDLLVTIETELWPNLLALARYRGIRTAVANARLSDRSFRPAQLLRWHYRWMLGKLDAILAQSATDAERFRALGADPDTVAVTGNIKFDQDFPAVSPAEMAKLQLDLGLDPNVPVWVVGSTREGEETMILDAFAKLRLSHHDLQIVIAPRHPERGEEVAELVRQRGYRPLRRTELRAAVEAGHGPPTAQPEAPDPVVILDTVGELTRVYALADVVTVGGSFIKWGGHNILEPMAYGKPVIVGPHTHNFRDIVRLSLESGAVMQLAGAEELPGAIGRVLESPADAELLSVRARQALQDNKGAATRTARRLVELMHQSTPWAPEAPLLALSPE